MAKRKPPLRLDYYDPRRVTLPKSLVKEIKVRRLGRAAGYTAWLVDGAVIRNEVDIDFAIGGNPARYAYVPENEVWLEDTGDEDDMKATFMHEVWEADAMRRGGSYGKAHGRASAKEKRVRASGALPTFLSNPERLMTICMWCKRVIFPGPTDPQGMVSHAMCYDCAAEHAEELGITEEDLEEMREEQQKP